MIRIPDDTQRSTVIGRTGSGKSQAALWQLSLRSWRTQPWIIFDFKRDKTIREVLGGIMRPIELGEIPTEPGIYICQPLPDQGEEVDAFMYQIWEHENIGVYVDEVYMIGDGKGDAPGFRALLTQGRSKHIPMINLTQRPSRCSRFTFSEADFFQIFWLIDAKDRDRIAEIVPFPPEQRLPQFYSFWYDVGQDQLNVLSPVPVSGDLRTRFEPTSEEKRVQLERAINISLI